MTIWIVFIKSFCPNCEGTVQVEGAYRDEEVAENRVKSLEGKFSVEMVYKESFDIE